MTVLERERRARGLSQKALGQQILYSNVVISRLESGAISIEQIGKRLRHALETFFGLTCEDLLKSVEPSSERSFDEI